MQVRYIRLILTEEAVRQFNQNYGDCLLFKYDKYDVSYKMLGDTEVIVIEVYDMSTKENVFVINMNYVIAIDFCFYMFIEGDEHE